MTEFARETLNNHIRLHVMPTTKFKTYAITVMIGTPLQENHTTKTALIPFVLRRGNQRYPQTSQFREKLEELYGAGFGFDVSKRGDYHMVQLRMDVIHERFVQGNQSLLGEAIAFLGETLSSPLVEGNGFRKKYVDTEKTTLQKRLESIINDKIRYAAERCIEEMCSDEPYRIHPLGRLEDISQINEQSLYEAYQHWLEQAMIDIYVVGDTSLNEVKQLTEQYFKLSSHRADRAYQTKLSNKNIKEIKRITEELDVTQGKLNLGLRSNTSYGDNEFPAALMYNGVLGGYPHSKLFVNVREKASLAYYAASRLDGHKGFLTIQSGIEFDHYEQALEIIQLQLEQMKNGQISELELQQTKAMICNQLREMADSPYEMSAFDFNRLISGKERQLQQFIEDIQAVQISDITAFAEQIQLDTIYFLRNKKEVSLHAQ